MQRPDRRDLKCFLCQPRSPPSVSFSLIKTPLSRVPSAKFRACGALFLFSVWGGPGPQAALSVINFGPEVSDTLNISEALLFDIDTALSDTLGVTEALTLLVFTERSPTDSVTIADVPAILINRPVADSISVAETSIFTVEASWPRDMPADSLESGNLGIWKSRNLEIWNPPKKHESCETLQR